MTATANKTRTAHKFGGSSVADAECINRVAGLIREDLKPGQQTVVVVSAMRGVTDALIHVAHAAFAKSPEIEALWSALKDKHFKAIDELKPASAEAVKKSLTESFTRLSVELKHLRHVGKPDGKALLEIQGLGEVWSAQILHAVMNGSGSDWAYLDAREVLVVSHNELGAVIEWSSTQAKLNEWKKRNPAPNVVVTGFVASETDGTHTTLGRNGSDFSGAIFANLFDARELTIWTDVNGVLSADPRKVPDAITVPTMSYAEACELAYFGAKVIHPQTLAPAMLKNIPIWIKNTFAPGAGSTLISAKPEDSDAQPVKGLSLIENLAILEVAGSGMIGVPGTAERVFSALHAEGVSVVMITQGSSEHSICCVVRQEQSSAGIAAVRTAFAPEIESGHIQDVNALPGISVLAAVGDGMVGTPGIAATLMSGLARARINIRAIAQGSSERNISVAVSTSEATRALRAAHTALWLSSQTLSIGLLGAGNVGRSLLRQISETREKLAKEKNINLQVRAIANSKQMQLSDQPLGDAQLNNPLKEGLVDFDEARFVNHVHANHLPQCVIIDCTGSAEMAKHYASWLQRGIHVVTPSKRAGSGDIETYRAIQKATRSGAQFKYEATVGAGLPIMQTLRSLLDTGDELLGVEGMLSGTLAWLFNKFDGTVPFSELVREAHRLGYTEPDPRDDLGGVDVARKLVILAREAGWSLSVEQVKIESLVPADMAKLSRDEFMAQLSKLDAPMQQRLTAAKAENRSLRYVAALSQAGQATVGLMALPADHACCHTQLTDNLVQFRTRRYANNPLVVKGPGAGPEVTAAGVFGDLLMVASSVGARL